MDCLSRRAANTVFGSEETHGRALRKENDVIAESPAMGWCSLYAATFREAPLRAAEAAVGHPSLIYHLKHPTEVIRRLSGSTAERAVIVPGRFCLTPGDADAQWQHSGSPEILQLYLRRSVYDDATEQTFGARASLVPRYAVIDPLLEQLALAVLSALRDGSTEDRLYVETIAQLIGAHLARTHSARARPRAAAPTDGLSRARLSRLIDYIDAHLGEDLSLEALAAEISLSPLYFVRAFRAATGRPPHRYVVERRIEQARKLLSGTDLSIADVALRTGFSSQSHLSAWFRRLLGTSPAAFRRHH